MNIDLFWNKANFLLILALNLGAACSYSEEFPFEPPKSFILNPKYIGVHHPVQTSKVLAQLYFDQGFTFLYAFNHDAAYWSFVRASEADPTMAMSYWGKALALGTNINISITSERSKVAYEAVQKGLQLSLNDPESDRNYIQALAHRYSNDPNADPGALAKSYTQAMRELSAKYPDDLDAAVLFAESLLDLNPWNQWSADGKPLEGTMEAVKKLESVLKRDPNHLGANHYYIHAVETSHHPEVALMSAERLKTLLPSSGHILHMPSHIYMLVGDYHQAARSNEDAIAVDLAYIREYGLNGIYPVHYLTHNYYVLARAYTMEGRYEDAIGTAQILADFYTPHFKRMPELQYYASSPLTVFLTFKKWDKILEAAKPSKEMKLTLAIWRFCRAMAYASLGDISEAEKEKNLFFKEKENLSPDELFGYNAADDIIKIADHCLKAKLEEAKGNFRQAVDFLNQAVSVQDALRYNEPPDWFFPIRESLGALLLKMNQASESEKVFRDELNRHPRSGRALFGLGEALMAQSKHYDFYWVNGAFQKAWLYSDTSLTINKL